MNGKPFDILGVEIGADQAAIKSAYRKKAMNAHSDQGGSHDQMVLLNWANDTLKNPEKYRQCVDQKGYFCDLSWDNGEFATDPDDVAPAPECLHPDFSEPEQEEQPAATDNFANTMEGLKAAIDRLAGLVVWLREEAAKMRTTRFSKAAEGSFDGRTEPFMDMRPYIEDRYARSVEQCHEMMERLHIFADQMPGEIGGITQNIFEELDESYQMVALAREQLIPVFENCSVQFGRYMASGMGNLGGDYAFPVSLLMPQLLSHNLSDDKLHRLDRSQAVHDLLSEHASAIEYSAIEYKVLLTAIKDGHSEAQLNLAYIGEALSVKNVAGLKDQFVNAEYGLQQAMCYVRAVTQEIHNLDFAWMEPHLQALSNCTSRVDIGSFSDEALEHMTRLNEDAVTQALGAFRAHQADVLSFEQEMIEAVEKRLSGMPAANRNEPGGYQYRAPGYRYG